MYASDKINLRNSCFLFTGIVALFFSFRNIYGEDIGFHLHAGRWMMENFSLPPNDIFTYTTEGIKYIDLNWIYQLLLYGIYSLAGSAGLILINSLFISGALFFLYKRISCRLPAASADSYFSSCIFLLAVFAVSPLFEIRPHSVSWLLLCVTLYILQKHYEGNEKIIRWLPLVMLLWVNMHSLFILGLVALGCYAVSVYWKEKKLSKTFLIYGSASLLVCFLNPYGLNGFIFPFEQAVALKSGNVFKESIRELQSPFSAHLYEGGFFHALFHQWIFFDLFTVIAFLSLIVGYKKRKLHEWLLFLVFFYFAFSAVKNTGYFIFAVTPIVILGFIREKKVTTKLKQAKLSFAGNYFKQFSVAFILLCLLLIFFIRSNALYIHYRASYRFGFGWSNHNLPVKATEWLLKNNVRGKILNQMDYGGYLEFFTNQKVSIDGRVDFMGEKNFNEQVNAEGDAQKQNLLDKYNPDIIIFSYFVTPEWIVFLQKQFNWRLAYVDGNAAVYLKNDFANIVPPLSEQSLLSSVKNFSNEEIDSLMHEKKNASVASLLFHRQYFPDEEHNLIAFCFYYGWMNAAKQFSANAFLHAASAYPEMYQNLGSVYFQLKDKNRSLFCYEKYLSERKNEQVQQRVEFLKSLN
ncbi:MAG: hypothetical protein HY063_14720 [Bacteroidetes bacterium]|nr:hypothetical protein [Bacteroidota bacterium]